MRNAGLEKTQAGIKIAGRSLNNLRYADDTTLMTENEKENQIGNTFNKYDRDLVWILIKLVRKKLGVQ